MKKYLDLLHCEVEEGEVVPDLDGGLGARAAHGGSQTTVKFEHHELLAELLHAVLGARGDISICDDHLTLIKNKISKECMILW